MDNDRGSAGLFLCTGLLFFILAYSRLPSTNGVPRGQFLVLALWAYVLLVDNLGYWLSGASLLVSRPREVLPLLLGSLGIGCVFEILNLRLALWHYVNAPLGLPARWGMLISWWATLLPFIFVTAELMSSLGFSGRLTTKRFAVSRWLLLFFYAAGLAMFGLALAFPKSMGPLIFGAFFFLAEPVNFSFGLPSLLRELSWGLPGKTLRLIIAGLAAALAGNWINNLSGANSAGLVIKTAGVLRSPIAAYAAFAFFTVEVYSLYSLCSAVRSGKTWEKGLWVMRGKTPDPYFAWVTVIAVFAVVCTALCIVRIQ